MMGLPSFLERGFSFYAWVCAAADRLPRASLAQNSATKKLVAEGLVFASKAGNKPVKDG